jgi:nucleotide-binding universal stress UspA family protein
LAISGYGILLPTDGSYPAIAATVRAIELARDRKGKLIILKVIGVEGAGMEKIAEDSALMRTAGIDGVAYAQDMAKKNGINFEVVYREGAVVGEIVRTATEKQVDIIVMGSSTIKGLPGLYLGSVSRGVIKEAPCDVVVVKLTEDEMNRAVQLAHEIAAAIKAPPPVKFDISDITKSNRFRTGAILLAIYGATYAIFIALAVYSINVRYHHQPQTPIFSIETLNMNVGLVFGFAVIFLAIVMAVFFNWYAGRSEKKSGGN